MMLLTQETRRQLASNLRIPEGERKPYLKLFCPWGAATWLISEIDEDGRMFGLCDLGDGCPELGYVMLSDIEKIKGPFGLKIERDRGFTPDGTLGWYTARAREERRIMA